MTNSDRLIVALDVPVIAQAEKLVKTLSPTIKVFKVGKELFTAAGPQVVQMIHASGGKVFLDLKFHDIPHTVSGAVAAATRLGVFMMNVHALGGKSMLYSAAQGMHKTAEEEKQPQHPLLLGVTILTSLTDKDLKEVGIGKKVKDEVANLSILAQQCGLDGVVASGHEIELVRRAAGKNFLIVTPGVRPVWAAQGDQKRIVTPREAFQKGADYIVIGRPIIADKDPLAAADKILKEIE